MVIIGKRVIADATKAAEELNGKDLENLEGKLCRWFMEVANQKIPNGYE